MKCSLMWRHAVWGVQPASSRAVLVRDSAGELIRRSMKSISTFSVLRGCDPGTYSTGVNPQSCTECNPGEYQPNIESIGEHHTAFSAISHMAPECDSCEQGKFSSSFRSSACQLCPPGRYQVSCSHTYPHAHPKLGRYWSITVQALSKRNITKLTRFPQRRYLLVANFIEQAKARAWIVKSVGLLKRRRRVCANR